jgi:hypothetical protein
VVHLIQLRQFIWRTVVVFTYIVNVSDMGCVDRSKRSGAMQCYDRHRLPKEMAVGLTSLYADTG